ncbi:MAG TPA: hypothetical protein VNN55_01495 [bacterium]|nr:hypothetical protein [bacterium]
MRDPQPIAELLRRFLRSASDPVLVEAVFMLATNEARAYLSVLRNRRPLPLSEFGGEDALGDLAIDCVAEMLAPDPRTGVPKLASYLSPYRDVPDKELSDRFSAIICGQVRQRIPRIDVTCDPSWTQILRGVRRALISAPDEFAMLNGHSQPEWRWRPAKDGPRDHAPCADRTALRQWAYEAVRDKRNIPEYCRVIFACLDQSRNWRNSLTVYALAHGLDDVLAEPEYRPDPPQLDAQTEYLRRRFRVIVAAVAADLLEAELPRLAQRQGLTDAEHAAFVQAMHNLTADWVEHGSHDLLPVYLREELGDVSNELYASRFKYIWDTLVKKCKQQVSERMESGRRDD